MDIVNFFYFCAGVGVGFFIRHLLWTEAIALCKEKPCE